MTDAESRALVATQIRRGIRATLATYTIPVEDGERLATAFATLSDRIIDFYLSNLTAESPKENV